MKRFQAKDLTRNIADLWTAATGATLAPVTNTKHRRSRFVVISVERNEALLDGRSSQVSVDITNMPDELGELFGKGVEQHFRNK